MKPNVSTFTKSLFFSLLALSSLLVQPSWADEYSKIVKLHNSSIDVPADDGFNLNFETSTGLTWLDASISKGYSTAEIKKRIADPNDAFYGFRYATQEEIEALLVNYGLPKLGEVAGAASASAFIADFGRTGTTQLGPSITPVWPHSGELNQYKQVVARTKENISSVGQGGIDPKLKRCHFLVGGPSVLATYKNCVVYTGSTDYYFTPEGEDKEIQLRDRNSVYQFRIINPAFRDAERGPEDVDIRLEDQLIDPSNDLEGIPGANPEMVGKLFLLIYNKDGKLLVVKKVSRSQAD